jgi:phosphoenolpyruvate synthase/pyruvate phosphate dikinase
MLYFLSFQEILKDQLDAGLIGGKAKALAQLYQNGFPIPNGFVATTEFFNLYLKDSGISANDIKTIFKYIDECSSRGLVAVRSSATVEDSNKQSFAGQFDTFLKIKKEDVPEAIRKCWQSLFSPRVSRYAKNGNNTRKMAVLIQEMIYPEVSGVAFSVHPVTNDSNFIVIEAILGSNELLVQGAVTPDCYIINKQFKIFDKKVVLQKDIRFFDNKKESSIRILTEGGGQKLPDSQIIAVAQMVSDVENFFHHPVDIEWAISHGKIYILQSRPITTIN